MEVNLTLVLTCGVLCASGVYLMLERSLTRVLVGLLLLSNGINLALIVASGPAGESAFYGSADPADMADPLPQALVLTAIVITLGTVAFVLAMAHRSWQLNEHDDVQDDVEDAAIRRLAISDATSDSHSLTTSGDDDAETPGEEDGS
ncbi:Na(+)/H(+) antiporter subunit C [Nocardioides aequoreus]|uniref:Na(+)/H(+) antiporter subunit C n=1 Tax=Nocardioides aequoreus TaxID=397278 RepID=UPI00056C6902|nr:Na(+)/H(+) antiporter subunit C [Nocardioides aequoreus]